MSWILAVAGDCPAYDRFRICWDARRPGLGSLAAFAQRIGVHPSSLTRSNFRLAAKRRAHVASILQVPPGFLGPSPDPDTDLPDFLRPLRNLVHEIQAVCSTAGGAHQDLGFWAMDAQVLRLDATAVTTLLPAHPAATVIAVHGHLAAIARRQLATDVSITLSMHDWCHVIETLVARALASRPDELNQPALKLARRLHRSLHVTARA